jgi:inosose dehydratase
MWKVGNAPTSWGIEHADDPSYPEWSSVLDEIAKAGYSGVELGPLGYLPSDPAQLGRELTARGLSLSAGTVMTPLWGTLDEPLALAGSTIDLTGALRTPCLVLIDGLDDRRSSCAGDSGRAERLDDARFGQLVDNVNRIAERAAAAAVAVAFHPHAGTHVEFRDEIDQLLAMTDPELVRLCVDTGHSAYAGVDPAELIGDYSDRLACVHLKDVDPAVLETVLSDRLGFDEAYERAVFCVLGKGCVDFTAVRAALETGGYAGWLTVEQDALPLPGTNPYDDAVDSLAFLRRVGLAADVSPPSG